MSGMRLHIIKATPNQRILWTDGKTSLVAKGSGREEVDTFPTVYRLNSRSAIRRHLRKAGFHEKELVTCECSPNYLTFSAALFHRSCLREARQFE